MKDIRQTERPRPDERKETGKRPDKGQRGAGEKRSGHRPGDREDPLPCHIDPQKPAGPPGG